MSRLRPVLLLLLLCAGCQPATALLLITAITDASARDLSITQLDLEIVAGTSAVRSYRYPDGQPITFPTTLTAEVREGAQAAVVILTGKSVDGSPIVMGQVMVPLKQGDSTFASITLSKR